MSQTLPLLIVLLAAAVSSPAAAAPPSNHWPDHRQLSKLETPNPAAPSTAFTYVALEDNDALCLDGSHYGYFICRAGDERWEINLQGGGWCYNETECLERASTPLGSSSTWPGQAAQMRCDPSSSTSFVMMYYCDGASFSGNVANSVPVGKSHIYFRGSFNLDRTLSHLFQTTSITKAKTLVVTGGSAGGLSTFLHLDHVAALMKAQGSTARVVGLPVCGFFIDHDNDGFAPLWYTYPNFIKYVFEMQNCSGILSQECQNAYDPDSAYKCMIAPHAAGFVKTPWFALQSRFDKWSLGNELFLKCMNDQPYGPPYKPSSCKQPELDAITSWGPAFMQQLRPYIDDKSPNGGFIDACIIHGSTNSSIDGSTNYAAFETWLAGGRKWWLMTCGGSSDAGPCDPSPICAPFP